MDKFDFLAVNGGGSRVHGVQESREIFIYISREILVVFEILRNI